MSQEDASSTGMLEFLAWVEVNKKRLAIGAGIAVAAGFGVFVAGHFKAQRELEANGALLSLHKFSEATGRAALVDAQSYLGVVEKHAGTGAAGRALLQAAGAMFEAGKYAEAKAKFDEFASRHADSPLLPVAVYGAAACLDAMNDLDKAITAYDQVISGYASDPISTQAKLAKALVLLSKNQPAEARRILEEVSRAGMEQGNSWQREAMTRLQMVDDKFPELAAALTATNAPAAVVPPATQK